MKKIKRKKYSTGGDIVKGIGAGLYGVTEGFLDNLSMGATDKITDAGYNALSKLGNNSANFQKTSNIIRNSGNIGGQVTGAVLSGGATTSGAISGGLKSANDIVQNTNASAKAKKWVGLGTQVGSMVSGTVGGNAVSPNTPESIIDLSKNIQFGGKMQLGGILDAPQKGMMKLATGKYQKPSEYLYANGLKEKYPNRHEELALAADLIADPLNLLGAGEIKGGVKAAQFAAKSKYAAQALEALGNVDDVANYAKKKATAANKWLGETTGFKFQQGGQMTQNIMPQNPNDIEDETENTVEYQGNPHTQGGIPLQNGAELEKDETVIKPQAVGNKNAYAISPNLILDRATAKQVGLPSKYAGYKLSDISRMIEDTKPKQSYGDKATAAINKKFALKKLMQANELLSARHREQNGVQEESDLRQEEMQHGGYIPKKDIVEPMDLPEDYNQDTLDELLYDDGITIEYNRRADGNRLSNGALANSEMIADNTQLGGNKILPKYIQRSSTPSYGVVNRDVPTSFSQQKLPNEGFPSTSEGFKFKMPNEGQVGMGIKAAALLGEAALIGKKPNKIPTQYNMRGNEALDEMRNRKIDTQPIINNINSQMTAARGYNNDRSFNVQRGLNANTYATGLQKLQEATMAGQEINNKYKGEYANMLNNLGQQDVNSRNMAEVLNTQTQDNWKNRIGDFTQNIGNGVGDMLLKKDAVNKFNAEHFQILKESAGDYGISVTNTADYMKLLSLPDGQLIVGKMANKEPLTPEEQAQIDSLGKGSNYKGIYGVKPSEDGISTLQTNYGKPKLEIPKKYSLNFPR